MDMNKVSTLKYQQLWWSIQ